MKSASRTLTYTSCLLAGVTMWTTAVTFGAHILYTVAGNLITATGTILLVNNALQHRKRSPRP